MKIVYTYVDNVPTNPLKKIIQVDQCLHQLE